MEQYLKGEVDILEKKDGVLNCLCLLQPFSLSLMMFRKGLKIMKKKYFEDIIAEKNIDKKDLFSYLIEDRIFISSLSNDSLNHH